ncbi:MAG: TldD/PmbA family protein, partial [Actinomycetota bacterium]|nr:TldD/PmbA family protein [Actinomycetota bacterium]
MRLRELTDLAATVVELIGNAEPNADVEVTTDRTEQALTRFANSTIHQNVADESAGIRLRLHLDGRTITLSSSTASTGDELSGFVDRALHTVRSGPADPGWPGVAPA